MLIIGHRGAKGLAPENTLVSFQKALACGVDAIELDVWCSADKQLMVIHDETLERTTTQKGLVNHFTTLELQKLGIPTLEDVFLLVNQQCVINVEIKDPNATEKVVALMEHYVNNKGWNYSQFQISSFFWDALATVFRLNTSIPVGVLTENDIASALLFAKQINAHSINPYYKLLDATNTKAIQENGFKLYTWTVNVPEDVIFVKMLQVDGIITDFPDRFLPEF